MVDAIVTYTHKRIRFDYRQGRPTKSAWDAHEEQVDVCRGCPSGNGAVSLYEYPRALLHGLYGRYGLPAIVGDMNFSAWFEAYLEGRWFTFDARHDYLRKGRVLMARGRDATGVA